MDENEITEESLVNIDKQVKDILQITRQEEVIRSFVRAVSDSQEESQFLHEKDKKVTSFKDSLEKYNKPKQKKLTKYGEAIGKGRRSSSLVNTSVIKYPGLGVGSKDDDDDDVVVETRDKKFIKKSKRHEVFEVYTDKDRAAAVNLGSRDIKQSLRLKRRQDRSKILEISEEAHPGTLLALGNHELRHNEVKIAVHFINKALELNPYDKNALVARSKCRLLLGEPQLALEDAEKALSQDKTFIKGIYEKAEALYYLGKFEHSLMYFHRGLNVRPDMEDFRLGVQKSEQAIMNTVGKPGLWSRMPILENSTANNEYERIPKEKCFQNEKQSRCFLKDLYVDKKYLENLLHNPDIQCFSSNSVKLQDEVKDGVQFLNDRQEFWRQQQPFKTNKRLPRKN